MQALNEYGLFLFETITLVAAILFTVSGLLSLSQRGKSKDRLSVRPLNDKYEDFAETINRAILDKTAIKRYFKQRKKKDTTSSAKPRLFILNFEGDIRASAVESLRHEITAILTIAEPTDRVFIRIESPGGLVHSYGYAASQLERIKQRGLKLIVSIDKVAASGGYLMACLGDQILAAPFAIIGSIGVLFQLPNFNRLLKKNHVDFEQLTAGDYKRTLTVFGENTTEAREKMRSQLEETHQLFKEYIHRARPHVDINQVATGEYWYGTQAGALHLIDEIKTSDDYLLQARESHDLFEITYEKKKTVSEKLQSVMQFCLAKIGVS